MDVRDRSVDPRHDGGPTGSVTARASSPVSRRPASGTARVGPPAIAAVHARPGRGVVMWAPPLVGWLRSAPADGATPDDLRDMVSGVPLHPLERVAQLASRLADAGAHGGFVTVVGDHTAVVLAGSARTTISGADGWRTVAGPGEGRCDLLRTTGPAAVAIAPPPRATAAEATGGPAGVAPAAPERSAPDNGAEWPVLGGPGLYDGGGIRVVLHRPVTLPPEEVLDEVDLPAALQPVLSAQQLVVGTLCDRDHVNHPRARHCARCGLALRHIDVTTTTRARPAVGALVADDGVVHPLDRHYVVGRAPHADERVRAGVAAALTLDDPDRLSGRRHAEVWLEQWDVVVRDLSSRNGTRVHRGGTDVDLGGGGSTTLEPGDVIVVGGRTFAYTSPIPLD